MARKMARTLVPLALLGPALLGGCSAPPGMYCKSQSECGTELICSRPTLPGGAQAAYGVCQPALRGLGETCLYTSECQTGLLCSNTIFVYASDQRHGWCEAPDGGSQPDAAPAAVPDGGNGDAGAGRPGDGGD